MTRFITKELKISAIPFVAIALSVALLGQARAEPIRPLGPRKEQKKASELIQKQDPPKVHPRVLQKATADNVSITLSLGKQRAYFFVGQEVAIDSPISSGKRAGMTPKGTFKITERDKNHRSSVYGSFVSRKTGKVVRGGVSTKIDSAPSGTVYRGAPMNWFMRMTNDGVGMHTGVLPGYPASHGCIRLPEEIAKLFYQNSKLGTVVTVTD